MAVELRLAWIAGQPCVDEGGAVRLVPALVQDVCPRMRPVRIARRQRERSLDERRARRPPPRLRQREAMHAEKPPVLAIRAGQRVEQRGQRLVPVLAPAEPDQPVHARGRREHHGVARKLDEVLGNRGKRAHRIPLHRDGERLDVPALPRRASRRQHASAPRRFPRLRHARLQLEAPRAPDVGQRKSRIGGDRPSKPPRPPHSRRASNPRLRHRHPAPTPKQ